MFKLPREGETFPTRCVIETPVGEGSEECEIKVHFRILPARRFAELAREGDDALLAELIGGWEYVCDAKGAPLTCTAENVAAAAELPYFTLGVIRGYQGRFAPLKNSKGPLGF